uniref:Uncharacterized protein TCIL3000_10_8240 n=1 Tax=Trypanosoma congolense (strain IL3000) TaxID=1068625 RepID=G0UXD1_TRYCI|nr:unnamed protein product [Trypanosoma congolense IL3000]
MEYDMSLLIRENARLARETRGVASLQAPQNSDESWRLRYNTLLRSKRPQSLTPPADNTEETGGEKALLVLNNTKHQEKAGVEVVEAQKKPRQDHGAVVSVNSSVPKNSVSATEPRGVGKNSDTCNEAYVPPVSWKMYRVLVGHRGWVWSAAVDPSNSWFATGGGDGVIKVWDLTTGAFKLNLTGHKEAVRSLSISALSPYMFTGSDDHSVKCWDLERNEIVRDFHGHKGSVHCVSVHPSLDIVLSGGRDKTVRVWDVRTRSCVHLMLGHTDSVMSLCVQQEDPQVISGGSDGMVYLWDVASGRAFTRLTRHKKPVRGLALSRHKTLASCGADRIRLWSLPTGEFLYNVPTLQNDGSRGDDTDDKLYRWSCCSTSPRNVLAVGSQEGKLALFDWEHVRKGPFQFTKTRSVPGTLPGEGGINSVTFDVSGSRMITTESDKSVKVWRAKE